MVPPNGFCHNSFVISAVTLTQCTMWKLEKLELTKSHRPIVRGGFLVGVEGRRVWVVGRAAVRMGGCRC